MRRRTLIAFAGSLALLGYRPASVRAVAVNRAHERVARAALRELDGLTLRLLSTLSRRIQRLTPAALTEAVAEDFRTGRTIVLERVLLSRHEVAAAFAYRDSSNGEGSR